MRRYAIAAAPLAVLTLAVTVFYWTALIHPVTIMSIPVDGDVVNYFRPHTLDQFRYMHEFGELAQWNDRVAMGAPAIGQFGTYYPPRLAALKYASTPGLASDLLVWAHALLAALATYALARLYGIRTWAAVVAGQFYALSHLAVRWAPFFHSPPYFAALPVSILGVELIWRRRTSLGVPLLALGIGAACLGGHLQNAHLLIQLLAVFVLFRALLDAQPWRARLKPLGWSAAGFGLGTVVSLPAIVPFVIAQSDSVRKQSSFDAVQGMVGRSIGSAFDPVVAADPRYLNCDLYLALAAPPLILLGIYAAARSRTLAPMLIVLALALLIGFKTPLLNLLMAVVPGWEVVSNVQRMSFVMVLPLAILAGAGLDLLLRLPGRRALLAGAAMLLATAWFWKHPPASATIPDTRILALALVAAAVLGLLALRPKRAAATLVAVPLALAAVSGAASLEERQLGWEPAPDKVEPRAQEWIELLGAADSDGRWMSYCQELDSTIYRYRPVMFLERRGRWLDTYDSFIADDFYTYWSALTGSHRWDHATGGQWDMHTPHDSLPKANLVDAAGIRKVLGSTLCHKDVAPLGWRVEQQTPDFIVYDNPGAYPDAYVTSRFRPTDSPRTAVESLSGPRTTFAEHTDYVEGAVHAANDDQAPVGAHVTRDGAEHLTVRIDRPSGQPTLLALLDHYAKGWKATSGGQDLEITRVNGTFRGVVLPPGATSVAFAYTPWWNRVFKPVSWGLGAVLLIWLAGAVLGQPERRRRRTGTT